VRPGFFSMPASMPTVGRRVCAPRVLLYAGIELGHPVAGSPEEGPCAEASSPRRHQAQTPGGEVSSPRRHRA
jgi:hypothetical protein